MSAVRVAARDLNQGDRIEVSHPLLGRQGVTVLKVEGRESDAFVHVITRTDGGAEVVHEVFAATEVVVLDGVQR